MACRFPGADSPAAFWQNLATGVESVQKVPATRWTAEHFFTPPPYQPGKSISQWGAFLDDIQRFDAAFFGIPPAEASIMDPQQRILLELAYETLAAIGYANERRQGLRIGVFLGIGQNGYSELTVPLLRSGQPTHPLLVANNIRNLIAGQIAHSLNLTGPALVIDTACSSSLVALHMARQSLLAGDCDLALVGGINLNITPTPFVAFSSAGVLSASAHTYAFDERADGFVLGEGGGMLLLSTLVRAQSTQDPILAIVRGSAINNDGRSLGAMTPSPTGQEAVLRAAYANAAIDPATISYIEAHGTATRIGDIVEARALTRFFRDKPVNGPRYLGTVKSNIGHLLSAAGMPSLIKVLLAMQHGQLPPTLHSDQLRPSLKLQQAGFTLNQSPVDWQASSVDQPLRAGISGFGFGGTNAHLILEAPPATETRFVATPSPTFAHTHYWVENVPVPQPLLPAIPAATGIALPTAESEIDAWFQHVVWQPTPLPPTPPPSSDRTWLLLTTPTSAAQALAQALLDHLQIQGIACTQQPCPSSEQDIDQLLSQADMANCGIVLIGPVGPASPLASQATLDAVLDQGVFTLQRLARRLLALPADRTLVGLWVITAGAYAVQEADAETDAQAAPDRAALAGLAFALNSESGNMPCAVVDLPTTASLASQLSLLSAVCWRGDNWRACGRA